MTEGCFNEAEGWVSVEQVDRAARACMRRKGNRRDALRFRLHYGEEVLSLTHRLANGTYRPEPGIVFVTDRPKLREIHASVFRDRVVHHLLHELLAPRFEPSWCSRTFACRKGMGTHAAVRCLQRLVHDETRRGGRRAWALQLDVSSFFPSVHKPTLMRLLGARFSRTEREGPLFGLLRTVVEHDATLCARRRGRLDWFDRVPLHKRLGHFGPDRGLPIGNLTSQFFAGVYLAPLDHFIQRTLGIGGYVRYMDDLVLVHEDRARLETAHDRIRDFLEERLLLQLRPGARLEPVGRGVDFAGYVVRPTYSLVRNRVFQNLLRQAAAIETTLGATAVPAGDSLAIPGIGRVSGPCRVQETQPEAAEAARATWASFVGHVGHARGRRLLLRTWDSQRSTPGLLRLERGERLRVRRRFALPSGDRTLRSQLERLRRGLAQGVLLVQFGAHWRCCPPASGERRAFRPRSRGRRPWWSTLRSCGLLGAIHSAIDRGLSVGIALETGTHLRGPRPRILLWEITPMPAGVDELHCERGAERIALKGI